MATLKEKELLRLIEISKKFVDSTSEQLTYQEMSDYMHKLSSAKNVVFNMYDPNKKELKTVAL